MGLFKLVMCVWTVILLLIGMWTQTTSCFDVGKKNSQDAECLFLSFICRCSYNWMFVFEEKKKINILYSESLCVQTSQPHCDDGRVEESVDVLSSCS